jgi:mannose-1-phosphate guanylyltransferase
MGPAPNLHEQRDDTSETRPDAKRSTIVALVLAGSYHSTESAFAGLLPRPLMPVAQLPVIAYVLRWLQAAGIRRVRICTNGHAKAIDHCLAAVGSVVPPLEYVEDSTPRGPAGCTRDAALSTDADTFLVVDGTLVPLLDVQPLLDAHARSGAAVTAVVQPQTTSPRNGEPAVTPGGIYVFARRAFEQVVRTGFQDIKEHLIPQLRSRRERVFAYVARDMSPRVIDAETYLAVNHWAIEQIPAHPLLFEGREAVISGEVVWHPTAKIHPRARIVGPAVLGPAAIVGPDATLVGPVSIGARTEVLERAVVCRSVIWSECVIGAGAFVDHALVADGVAIRPAATVERAVKRAVQTSGRPRWRGSLRTRPMAPPSRPPVVGPALP